MKKYLLIILLLYIIACSKALQLIPVKSEPKPQLMPKTKSMKLVQPKKLTGPPILQINSGGHMNLISDIFFTRDRKHLISASRDKTIRVWNIQTGKTVRILRGQIGSGYQGQIFAAAISPDNQWLAVGGWIGFPVAYILNNSLIRLIHFPTGEIKHMLIGHSDSILSLSFSQNNKLLISGSFDNNAHIWDITTGKTIHTLKGHTKPINAVAFSPDNQFAVTGSKDHSLKLWQVSNGAFQAKLEGHEKEVLSVTFTADGQYILSGSNDKTIRLWHGKTGHFIKVMARQNSTVNSLSVSLNGTMVLTGQTGIVDQATGEDNFVNNIFSIPSGKLISKFTKHNNLVLATAISPDDTIAATGGGDGHEIFLWDVNTGREIRKMVGNGNVVWSVGFSKDGQSIAWGNVYDRKGLDISQLNGPLEKSFIFKSHTGQFGPEFDYIIETDFTRSIEKVGNIKFQFNKDITHPNSKVLKNNNVLHGIKLGRCFTLTPDGKFVITGSSRGFLCSYNTHTCNKEKYFVGHTGDVLALAVSPDGKFLISGSADQTIRLWEVATGKPLMSLFYGTDQEWVAWIPEGFFAASNNGAKYVGYHLNRGKDKPADYISVDQLYSLFYRPDLVNKKIMGDPNHDIASALKRIGNIDQVMDSGMPPKIEILPHAKKITQTDFFLKFKVMDAGGGIGKIEYRIDNVLVSTDDNVRDDTYAMSRQSGVIKKPFSATHGKHYISVTTYNKDNFVASKPVTTEVTINDPLKDAPDLYVLTIGISEYKAAGLQLKYANSDAKHIANTFKQRGKGLFKNIHLTSLLDQDAVLPQINSTFEQLSSTIKASDVFVLFIAGHGKVYDGQYFFIPQDAVYENSKLYIKMILSGEKLVKLLQKIKALKSLILIDTCFAAKLLSKELAMSSFTRNALEEKTALELLMKSSGRTALAAASSEQYAFEGYKNHGVFTYALLQGLKGQADNDQDGVLTIDELCTYARYEVPKITEKKWKYPQTPVRLTQGDSFAIGCTENNPRCKK